MWGFELRGIHAVQRFVCLGMQSCMCRGLRPSSHPNTFENTKLSHYLFPSCCVLNLLLPKLVCSQPMCFQADVFPPYLLTSCCVPTLSVFTMWSCNPISFPNWIVLILLGFIMWSYHPNRFHVVRLSFYMFSRFAVLILLSFTMWSFHISNQMSRLGAALHRRCAPCLHPSGAVGRCAPLALQSIGAGPTLLLLSAPSQKSNSICLIL